MASRQLKSLLDLIDSFTPKLQAAFLEAIQDIKDSLDAPTITKIKTALQQGDVAAAVNALGIEPAAMRPLQVAFETAFEQGGVFTASQFARQANGAIFRFDVRNSTAEAWLRDASSTLVENITTEQTALVQSVLQDGLAEGINPTQLVGRIVGAYDPVAGQRIGGVLGLNTQQAKYLANARTELQNLDDNYFNRVLRDKRFDRTVQKAIDSGTPLDDATINKLSTRYEDNLLQWRAETIGRTESISALNNAQSQSIQQLAESGNVDPSDIQREWDATHDPKTRQSHKDMDKQKVGPNEPFVTPDGAKLMFPGDTTMGAPPEETINCRCHLKINIDFIGAYKRKQAANGG